MRGCQLKGTEHTGPKIGPMVRCGHVDRLYRSATLIGAGKWWVGLPGGPPLTCRRIKPRVEINALAPSLGVGALRIPAYTLPTDDATSLDPSGVHVRQKN